MNQPSFYAVIPATVRYCSDLSPAAKLLYGEIAALANDKGYCWASNAYFSDLYGVEPRQVGRWVAQLVKRGFVVVKINKAAGNQRRIYLKDAFPTTVKKAAPPIDKNDYTYGQKRPYPIDKKDLTPISSKLSTTGSKFSSKNENHATNSKPPSAGLPRLLDHDDIRGRAAKIASRYRQNRTSG